tara:strand:- start:964 stop:1428 length:465 start_codon:yes stop_codon:yes gene_type:complete
MSKRVNKIIGLINQAHDSRTELSSQRIELGKAKGILNEAEGYQGDLEFFFSRYEIEESAVMKALAVLGDSVGALEKIKEEVDNQGQDADGLVKEAAKLAVKMDKIAQDMLENDLDANSVMQEVKVLDKAIAIGKQTRSEAKDVVSAINNLLAKI